MKYQNSKRIILHFTFSFCILIFAFCIFSKSEAATLYLEPSQGEYQLGDIFLVEIRIDTEAECINTVEANLEFSKDVLEVIDFSKGSSIITLWLKSPEINQELGLISFSGGIPTGYCGVIPGDPGPGHSLGKIALQAIQGGEAKIEFLQGTQVLLNDGLGTKAGLSTKGALLTVLAERLGCLRNEWLGEILRDKIPPEAFEIEIHQEPTIFEGKYFITFLTTDKQTGLDYFEVKEGKRDWKKAESPYLLEDQSLSSIIKVRAVDKAGNERIAEKTPSRQWYHYLITILVLIGAGLTWWAIQKIKNQKSK